MTEDADEDLLGDVLTVGGGYPQKPQHAQHPALVSPQEPLERVGVAFPSGGDQRLVRRLGLPDARVGPAERRNVPLDHRSVSCGRDQYGLTLPRMSTTTTE